MERENQQPTEIANSRDHDLEILQQTIAAGAETKQERRLLFDQIWPNRLKKHFNGQVFQVNDEESPFSDYSSKGWKIHIAFPKGFEREMAQFLFENGLYFKVESGIGTYFRPAEESGATVFVGSFNNTNQVAELINQRFGDMLTDGKIISTTDGRTIRNGSSTDIEIKPRIMARFDTAKTEYGWHSGNGKYAEHGLPTWTKLGGIPILKKYEAEIARVIKNWSEYSSTQRKLYLDRLFKPAYNESWNELVKDFGKEFLMGKTD